MTLDTLTPDEIPHELMDNDDLAFRIDRDGYTAFLYATGYNEFEVAHRQYHEDDWRRESVAKTKLLASVARFSHCAGLVEMPDLDTVEIELAEVEGL